MPTAADYRSPAPFSGRQVVVVGAGNSAVRITTEHAEGTRVALATLGPVEFAARRALGRDLHCRDAERVARRPTAHLAFRGGPPRTGSTCVNIDTCQMRRCCRCSKPTVRVWRRAARR
ncbi:hypothetical protein GCM10022384_46110 [Streptomyces marokkonensis]|uniref:Uncharacterized protein n=1 Tax=Streptomyces marokkonensis TaxID=324855 RepID=A0ABP7R6V0_9ACTN